MKADSAEERKDGWFGEAPCPQSNLNKEIENRETQDTSEVTSCFYDEKEFIYKTDSL